MVGPNGYGGVPNGFGIADHREGMMWLKPESLGGIWVREDVDTRSD